MGTFDSVGVVLEDWEEAEVMDKLAKKYGNEALVPLCSYPIPLKGTISALSVMLVTSATMLFLFDCSHLIGFCFLISYPYQDANY